MDTLKSLVEELINDPPINRCADNGENCPFCWVNINYWPSQPTEHEKNCWLERAKKILAEVKQ